DAAVASLADALGGLARVRELTVHLASTGAGEAGARDVADALRKLPRLEKLVVNLSANELGVQVTRELRVCLEAMKAPELRVENWRALPRYLEPMGSSLKPSLEVSKQLLPQQTSFLFSIASNRIRSPVFSSVHDLFLGGYS
ncbi:unnamed protein product, partial [Symbiodinium sp. KB8]